MNKAIARLKQEAARLGANGVLLEQAGDAGSVGTGFGSATASGQLHSVPAAAFQGICS